MERQALIDASVQPGGRAPAPEPLALVQAFVNTVDREHGHDLLEGDGWDAWCARRGFDAAASGSRAHARVVREALRTLLWHHAGEPGDLDGAHTVLEAAAARAGLAVRFGPARLEPQPGDAVGAVLAAAFAAMAGGTFARLKACPGERCGWAFYDRSVNGSSAWCSMRICGGRAKA